MDESSVRWWYQKFNEGLGNVHNENWSGCPSLVLGNLKQQIANFTDNSLMMEAFPHIYHSLTFEIITDHLGYKKICAWWVPCMLTNDHKKTTWLQPCFWSSTKNEVNFLTMLWQEMKHGILMLPLKTRKDPSHPQNWQQCFGTKEEFSLLRSHYKEHQ